MEHFIVLVTEVINIRLKDQPLIIVITATAYGTANGHSQVDKM